MGKKNKMLEKKKMHEEIKKKKCKGATSHGNSDCKQLRLNGNIESCENLETLFEYKFLRTIRCELLCKDPYCKTMG